MRCSSLSVFQYAAWFRHCAGQEVHGCRGKGRPGRRRLVQQRSLQHPARSPPSDAVRANEWMTAREVLELATLGGARVLGRSDIGSLEPGKCADFFSLDLHTIGYAGALHDPVAAILFCAPQQARTTVINGKVVVRDGEIVTMDRGPIVETHNRCAVQLANEI